MNPLFHAGLEFQNFLEARKWPFCFIGGLAVIRWGEIRMTQDIDLSLFSGFGNEEMYINELLETFNARITDALNFALENRVLLLSASNSVPVDISLSGLQFESRMIEHATPYPFYPGCSLRTCSAEDLIVLKAFADRGQDWTDIEGIIIRQGKNLDASFIIDQLVPLCELKEATEILDKLKKMFDEHP